MNLDRQTTQDLEIGGSQEGTLTVFSLVDRTRTAAGRERLRQRFAAPPSDVGSIRATQQAVRFLADQADWCRIGVEARLLGLIERYRLSAYTTIASANWVAATTESNWVRLRYPELLREAREGAAAVSVLLAWLRELCHRLLAADAPYLLRRLAEDALPAIGTLEPALVAEELRSARGVLVADRLLRLERRDDVDRLRQVVGELDALIAMATTTRELGFAFPELVAGVAPLLDVEGVWHPFLRDPVRNDLTLGAAEGASGALGAPDDGRLVFLTGPNMAGKTTFMKACGIAVFLAHLGMGVPARRLRLTPVDSLVSSIATADSVQQGYSYYFAEVQRVRAIAERLARGERCFVLCDEPFKGTNVLDALDASRAVIAGFAGCARSLFIVSSHLVELVDDLAAVPGVRFRCFEGTVQDGAARYDYRLRDGHSAQRLGLVLLQQAEVMALLAAGRARGVGDVVGVGKEEGAAKGRRK